MNNSVILIYLLTRTQLTTDNVAVAAYPFGRHVMENVQQTTFSVVIISAGKTTLKALSTVVGITATTALNPARKEIPWSLFLSLWQGDQQSIKKGK
jgi:hypothetical protein